jgi:dipeptidyl aminopeptidase/acylaminoacyl peptidase
MNEVVRMPVTPGDMFRLRFIQSARLRSDGRAVVYSLASVDEPGSAHEFERVNLWLIDLDTGKQRRLTDGPWRDEAPRWAPDGRSIAFVSDRAGVSQLYALSVDGGVESPLTRLTHGVGGAPVWSPQGDLVACALRRPPTDLTAPYRLTRAIPWGDAIGLVDDAVKGVLLVPSDGGEPRVLADDDADYNVLAWAPDGSEVYAGASYNPPDRMRLARIVALGLGGERRFVAGSWERLLSGAVTPDGQALACVGAPVSDRPFAAVMGLWRVETHGGDEAVSLSEANGLHAGPMLQCDMPAFDEPWSTPVVALSSCGASVFCQVEAGGTEQVWRFRAERDRQPEPILTGERTCVLFDVVADTLLFASSTLNDPPELCVLDIPSRAERRVTAVNDDVSPTLAPVAIEPLRFQGADGESLEGWFLRPPEGDPPYATVLYIHGGPATGFGHIYSFDFQMLAGAGMGVLIVNQRGSLGYSDEFSSRLIGDWGNLDASDLLSGVDVAVEMGLADPERLGCCGLSGGGYLTCWLAATSDRFRAAAAENPVTNWTSCFSTSDVGLRMAREWLGGAPWEVPSVYERCSPINYAHQCTTPTLLMVGEADHRCPPEQAEQFYGVLKATGCVTEMVRFPGASHDGSAYGSLATRRAQNEALLEWMRRYLLDEA